MAVEYSLILLDRQIELASFDVSTGQTQTGFEKLRIAFDVIPPNLDRFGFPLGLRVRQPQIVPGGGEVRIDRYSPLILLFGGSSLSRRRQRDAESSVGLCQVRI